MSTFLFKVMNLVVRTVAKPLISWVTHYKKLKFKEDSGSKFQMFIRKKLIQAGQSWNYYNVMINRKLFKISTTGTTISSLSEEKALEKGAEVMSEVIIYSLLIIIPLMEWWRLSKISKEKELAKEKDISDLKIFAQLVHKEAMEIDKEINEIKEMIEKIQKKIEVVGLNNKL